MEPDVELHISTLFPVIIWNIEKFELKIISTPDKLPRGVAFVIVKMEATGNDMIHASRIQQAIEKSYILKAELDQYRAGYA